MCVECYISQVSSEPRDIVYLSHSFTHPSTYPTIHKLRILPRQSWLTLFQEVRIQQWFSTRSGGHFASPGGLWKCFGHHNLRCVVKPLSCIRLLATPRTAALQVPLSMGFSRQEWSGRFLLQGIFPTQGSNLCRPVLADRFFTAEPSGTPFRRMGALSILASAKINTCIAMEDSRQCVAKPIQYCEVN